MEEFGVHRDLEAYKDIIDILPKGKYIPTNMFQAEFMHYPKQQQCIIDVLEQMENNGVCPDKETDQMVLNIFGRHGAPTKKLRRMAYWMPKFKNQSPWALPQKIPNSNLEIAKLAVQRMGSVDPATEMNIFQTSELQDAIDDTWIVNGQSANQRDLLAKLKEKQTVYVEGAFTIWLRRTSINYFILRSEPVPLTEEEQKQQNEYDYDDVSELRSWMFGEENLTRKDIVVQPSVHEQEDGTILAIAITGTCSKDSLLSWIRFLEKTNPNLANLSILFATNSPLGEVAPAIESNMPSQPLNKITGGSDL
ncbi:evolutionarily conserved signaling intermediate in Toll pathway, mitochondrial-like isoform X2 [Daphnia pulex]|nr:evolutionarily conserved signaling intermediate in Toll pathway, mitochondrial-like isoform X2 [Daphnia pulex]XP_046653308.1 evolutionarily conserved signaling intermediate in Toll pathway, mitochondrial-like isoform X2 [Daphnia pulicaria]